MRILQAHLIKPTKIGGINTAGTENWQQWFRGTHSSRYLSFLVSSHICIMLFKHFSDNLILKWSSQVKNRNEKGI